MFIIPVGNNIEKRAIPYVTISLIVINVLVLLYQVSIVCEAGTQELACQAENDFFSLFGLIPKHLAELKVLGLITYMFLHVGLIHLIGNMVMLYAFGPAIEHGLGRWTMLGFYGFFGLAGGIAHAAAAWGSEIPLVGASGAIAGLLGAYTVLYGPVSKIRLMVMIFFRAYFVNVPALLFGTVWFLLQLAHGSEGSVGGGVAWWCHIGGFVAGGAMAWVCRNELEGVLVAGSGDKLEMLTHEEIAAKEALEAEMEHRKANGLSSIVVPVQEAELAPPPTNCEHCEAELLEENKIGDQLYRCSGCDRMIYLSAQQADALSMT